MRKLFSIGIMASENNVSPAPFAGKQSQGLLLDGLHLVEVDIFKTSARCSSPTVRDPNRADAGFVLPSFYPVGFNPGLNGGVKFRCVQRAGSAM